jgi:phosphatidylinositol alpha-1,6-mannosyltransferase
MGRTLVITNDFPPRPGGIQTFGYEIVRRFEPDSVTVLTSDWEGAVEFDAAQDFKVIRASTKTLLPSKSTLAMAREIVVSENITRILFGAAAPLGLLASPLRKLGVKNIVGMTQGHETGWAMTPGTRQALRKIGNNTDYLTYISEYTHQKIAKALSPQAAARMRRIVPGVNITEFSPANSSSGNDLRAELGWTDRPVIVCVSRLMARKGQDELIRALPMVQKTSPMASLIIVGEGPYRKDLESLIKKFGLEKFVHLTGKVSQSDLSKWYAAGDIFAMPCRTRMGGWGSGSRLHGFDSLDTCPGSRLDQIFVVGHSDDTFGAGGNALPLGSKFNHWSYYSFHGTFLCQYNPSCSPYSQRTRSVKKTPSNITSSPAIDL